MLIKYLLNELIKKKWKNGELLWLSLRKCEAHFTRIWWRWTAAKVMFQWIRGRKRELLPVTTSMAMCVADEDWRKGWTRKAVRGNAEHQAGGKARDTPRRSEQMGEKEASSSLTPWQHFFNDHFYLVVAFRCHPFTRLWIQKRHSVIGIKF